MIWGLIFYLFGRHYYDNPKVIKDYEKMNNLLHHKKKHIKHLDDSKRKTRFGLLGGVKLEFKSEK